MWVIFLDVRSKHFDGSGLKHSVLICFSDWFLWFRVVSAVSRFGHESFRPWVVSAGSFLPGSFRPNFRVGRFGLIWWVVSAQYPPPQYFI